MHGQAFVKKISIVMDRYYIIIAALYIYFYLGFLNYLDVIIFCSITQGDLGKTLEISLHISKNVYSKPEYIKDFKPLNHFRYIAVRG